MLTPDELKVLPDHIVKIYEDLEEEIIRDIARRIKETGAITETAEFQSISLQRMGMDAKRMKQKIAEALEKGEKEVDELFRAALTQSVTRDNILFAQAGKDILDIAKSASMQKFIKANIKKTNGDLKNLTKSLGFKDGKQFKPVARFYQDTLNYAQFQIASGAFTYQQAVREAVRKLTESGLRSIDYEDGWSNRIDVAVRRATLTGLNQTASEVSMMHMKELGGEYVEVSAHAGARPDHQDWQGGVYHVGGEKDGYKDFESTTGYGTGDGLCGWNCRHSFYPFFPGISERNYTEEELKNIDPPPVEYDGKTYTYYEATQKQRQIERAIRKTKCEMLGYEAAELKDEFTWSSVLLRRQQDFYEDFSRSVGLHTKSDRQQLYGFGRSISRKGVVERGKTNVLKIDKSQAGKKMGKHMIEYGLDPKNESDRAKFIEISRNIVYNKDELALLKNWRGQSGPVFAHIKGRDVVLTTPQGVYITTMKGGIDNARVANARKRKF